MSASSHTISSSLTLSGFSLFIIVVFPLLSSPMQRTLSSVFLKPKNLPSLSKMPMITLPLTAAQNCFWKQRNKLLVTTHNAIPTAEERKLYRFDVIQEMAASRCSFRLNFVGLSIKICRNSSTLTGTASKYIECSTSVHDNEIAIPAKLAGYWVFVCTV